MRIEPLSPNNWNDFVSLMQTDAQCSECWCLNHREPAGCPTGDAARVKMQQLTSDRQTFGLLAFEEQICVGWLAIDPMDTLVGHDCQPSGQPNEWSIHCIFVRDGYRGQGISSQLIKASIELAKSKGAKLISAFPIPAENRNRFPPNEAEFSGRMTTFLKLGFRPVGTPTDFYQRMELDSIVPPR